MCTYDKEHTKMMFAMKCKHNKVLGFEGCKRCDDKGFYLQTYSREGYCGTCELECFPERFYPCSCCRLPQRLKMLCLSCHHAISENIIGPGPCGTTEEIKIKSREWGRKMSVLHDYPVKDCAAGNFIRWWEDPTICSNGDILPAASSLLHVTRLGKLPKFTQYWPGFYMGNGIWEKLDYLPELDDYGIVIKN